MVNVLANIISAVHLAYFAFIVSGFFATVLGARQKWDWIRNPWFRATHLLAVWFVLTEGWIGFRDCPLNVAERSLRSSSEGTMEAASGLGYILDRLLFHTLPGWFLNGLYWAVGIILLVLLFAAPPCWRRWRGDAATAKV